MPGTDVIHTAVLIMASGGSAKQEKGEDQQRNQARQDEVRRYQVRRY